jgi:NADPH-dependent curcumin reductase CurA
MAATAKTLILAAACNSGLPTAAHFRIESAPAPTAEALEANCVLVRVTHMSADPYLRGRIKADRPGATAAGAAMSGFVTGVVVASRSEKWAAGDLFGANLPFTTVQLLTPAHLAASPMWKLNGLCAEGELHLGLGALGMPGATAWGGLVDVLRPEAGQTLLVTAASGAVGQLVGQLAKRRGVRVIGSAGGAAKCAALKEVFGFDEALDYKAVDFEAELKRLAPGGLDMVFENVGGAQFEAAFRCLGKGGRLAVCGAIAEYHEEKPPTVAINQMVGARARARTHAHILSLRPRTPSHAASPRPHPAGHDLLDAARGRVCVHAVAAQRELAAGGDRGFARGVAEDLAHRL